MGQEENAFFGKAAAGSSSFADRLTQERAAQQEAERRALEDARADQSAVWALADLYLPADIREFGERHRIPAFAEHLWRSAFVAGWRAAMRAKP